MAKRTVMVWQHAWAKCTYCITRWNM